MKKQTDFLSVKWKKYLKNIFVTKLLQFHYGYVKSIDFYSRKDKI